MTRREWREDDPLNGPRMLFSAMVGIMVTVIVVVVLWRIL